MATRLDTFSEVSGRILGGADLFLQGVIASPENPPEFLANSVRTLGVPGNPIPFAVGLMVVSSTSAKKDGWKGRGLNVLHVFGDLLWQSGSKAAPNAGFEADRISAVEAPPPSSSAPELGHNVSSSVDKDASDAEASLPDCEESVESPPPIPAAGTEASMDEILCQCVLGGLHLLKTAQLPIQASDFYTKCMVPANSSGRPLDVKKSSFKKLSKLLDAFEKKKVLVQKVVRKQDCISSVNRESPEYLAHAAVPAPGAVPAAEAPKNSGTRMGSVTVAPCYRVPSSIRPIWGTGEDAGDKADVFTEEEVRAAAALYAERGGLLRQEGKATAIDAKQRSLLYGKKEVVPEELPLAALQARYLAKLTLHHRVLSRGPDGAERVTLRRGGLPIVSVSAEKRRGHAVTVVQHVEAFGLDASDVCSALQKQFQTSCKISEGPSKQDDDMLLTLQGDHSKGVSDILTQTYCIPKECIKASGLK
ncbi:hypothetical protein H632_c363p1 [Helicosporidium sp. ATCC 50920]|nr:hypothetical protein H632_c363p1 [Helicosporidium sp. ATCC 50920]|eukprot:KDD76084.1 hypothetical protein H632_c363p1 [Helicosporidium sp. ATCC 50920]